MISTLIGCQQFKKKKVLHSTEMVQLLVFPFGSLPPSHTHTHTHKIIKHMLPKENVIAQNVLFHSSGKLVSTQLC